MKMKVVFVTPCLSGGGAERVVSIWSSLLSELGDDIYVIITFETENEYDVSSKVNKYYLNYSRDEYIKESSIQKCRKLRCLLKDIQPDFVITFIEHIGVMTNISRMGLGIKQIETVRNAPQIFPQSKVWRILRKLSIALADYCIVQTNSQRTYFNKFLQEKMVVFSNPVDQEVLSVKRIEEYMPEIFKIVAVGRLEKQKNFKMLIKAFNQVSGEIPNCMLDIFGAGSQKDELEKLIQKYNLCNKVNLKGRSADIKEELIKYDLFILSSNFEGMPNALLEAMGVGLPCIATDCLTGPADVIENGIDGILTPVGDVFAMADNIQFIYENKNFALEMGERARKKIQDNYLPYESTVKLRKFLQSKKDK